MPSGQSSARMSFFGFGMALELHAQQVHVFPLGPAGVGDVGRDGVEDGSAAGAAVRRTTEWSRSKAKVWMRPSVPSRAISSYPTLTMVAAARAR